MQKHIETIYNDILTVQVNLYGACLWSIKDGDGTEYLWQGDAAYWEDRAPVLFPYIARLTDRKYTLDGQEYEMDIHGFAKDSVFAIAKQSETELVLRLKDSPETYRQYPYHFVFDVIYRLEGSKITVAFRVENTDTKTMYFGVGGHPGFNVPLQEHETFEDYYLEFSEETIPERVLFSDDCFVLGTKETFALDHKTLPLQHQMFDDDAIVLTNMPKTVTLQSKTGKKAIRVAYPQMDYLGFWHCPKTDAPYICIEPWSSLPSRKGVVEDLAKQENLKTLLPGEKADNTWSIEILL